MQPRYVYVTFDSYRRILVQTLYKEVFIMR